MGSPGKFFGNWTPDHAKALDAWKAYCLAAGIDINVRMRGQAVRPSEGIALLEALKRAEKGAEHERAIEVTRCILIAKDGESIAAAAARVANDLAEARAALTKTRPILPRAPGDRSPAKCVSCGRDVEPERLCYAFPTCYTCLPPPPPIPVLTAADDAPPVPANPIRSLREAAGLSQKQLADKMGVSKRAVQLQEMRPTVSAEMVARVKRAIGGGR